MFVIVRHLFHGWLEKPQAEKEYALDRAYNKVKVNERAETVILHPLGPSVVFAEERFDHGWNVLLVTPEYICEVIFPGNGSSNKLSELLGAIGGPTPPGETGEQKQIRFANMRAEVLRVVEYIARSHILNSSNEQKLQEYVLKNKEALIAITAPR